MEVKYYIVSKREMTDNVIVDSIIGYIEDAALAAELNAYYESSYEEWVRTNRQFLQDGIVTMSEFFAITPICHNANCSTNSIGEGLTLISNIDNLL